jgi:hypothetical protein
LFFLVYGVAPERGCFGAAIGFKIIPPAVSVLPKAVRLVSECWFGRSTSFATGLPKNQTESDDAIHDADDPEGL